MRAKLTLSKNFPCYFILTTLLLLSNCVVNGQDYPDEPYDDVDEFYDDKSMNVKILESNRDFTIKETINITLVVEGSCYTSTKLYFQHGKKEKDLIHTLSNVTIPVGKVNLTKIYTLKPIHVGHSTIFVNSTPYLLNMTDTSEAYSHLSIYHTKGLNVFSDIVGWVYFVAWSVSFYPQTYMNWKRKSVIGLHFDFLALNVLGFFVYSVFNVGLYWIPAIKQEYFKRHMYGLNPVQLNDVIFSLHAFLACVIQVIQCIIYERGNQKISKTAKFILAALFLASSVMLILSVTSTVKWLDYLYYLSYVKLFITLIKYIPQAYYNYKRKSTSGWSIGNILLDFTGGTLSIAQMFILAYNYDDWGSLFGDPTKFGLGLFSILFDIFFMIQHYILYRNHSNYIPVPADVDSSLSSDRTNSYGSIDPVS